MIFPLADQITPSTNSSQTFQVLTRSAKRGLKGANVQKNRVAKSQLAV